jgi:hypothetical protein
MDFAEDDRGMARRGYELLVARGDAIASNDDPLSAVMTHKGFASEMTHFSIRRFLDAQQAAPEFPEASHDSATLQAAARACREEKTADDRLRLLGKPLGDAIAACERALSARQESQGNPSPAMAKVLENLQEMERLRAETLSVLMHRFSDCHPSDPFPTLLHRFSSDRGAELNRQLAALVLAGERRADVAYVAGLGRNDQAVPALNERIRDFING